MKFSRTLTFTIACLFAAASCITPSAANPLNAPIDQTVGADDAESTTINDQAIDITDQPFAIRVQGIGANGASSSDGGSSGSNIGSIGRFENQSSGTIDLRQSQPASYTARGIHLNTQGGTGGDSLNSSQNGGAGGNAGSIGSISAFNQAAITFHSGTYDDLRSMLEAYAEGGNGGDVTPSSFNSDGVPQYDGGGRGGPGGVVGSVTLNNSGALTAGRADSPLIASGTAKGIHGVSLAGNPGTGNRGMNAPDSDFVNISNSGAISLFLQKNNTRLEAYGIRASTQGGEGTDSHSSGHQGGRGGHSGQARVTLTKGGDILVVSSGHDTGAGIQANATGGDGGRSFERTFGGNGGNANGVEIFITDASVTTVGDSLPAVQLSNRGGRGGDGGVQQNYSDAGAGGTTANSSIDIRTTDDNVTTGLFTNGQGSHGIDAKSLGGDGGIGADYINSFFGGAGYGGDGGDASGIEISMDGGGNAPQIITQGDQSSGIRALSLGGNGGRGGDIESDSALSSEASRGGKAGNGGQVAITIGGGGASRIQTSGAESHGIAAVSQGGEGGRAGLLDGDFSFSGQDGGNAGSVSIDLRDDSSIRTAGYSAFGVLAQSIGGGGGIGAEGSADGTGHGGLIDVAAHHSTLLTTGDVAHGIVLQSIGGGMGGQDASISGSFTIPVSASMEVSVGGGSNANGEGGDVNLSTTGLNLTTIGDGAIGLLTQSIGGGGGIGWAQPGTDANYSLGGLSERTNHGGTSTISLQGGSRILTSGIGSHGILSQSIGGGGGMVGLATGTPTYSSGISSGSIGGAGNGLDAHVETGDGTSIITRGNGAHGIFVQSIGGGGGVMNSGSNVQMGSSQGSGTGGDVSVVMDGGVISATGRNSVGILAQQDGGSAASGSGVNVTVNGTVVGGMGSQGYGVWILSKTNMVSTLTIGENASLSAISGNALQSNHFGTASLSVTNHGTLTGNVFSQTSQSPFVHILNTTTGTFNTGSRVESDLRNEGGLYIARGIPGAVAGNTVITGSFTQTSQGYLSVIAGTNQHSGSTLHVKGDASINGEIRLQTVPGTTPNEEFTFLTVDGNLSGDPEFITVNHDGIYQYQLSKRPNSFAITATGINFGMNERIIEDRHQSLADHLGSVWMAQQSSGINETMDVLNAVAISSNPGQVGMHLDELTPGATLGFAGRAQADSLYFSDSALNGPVFEGDTASLAEMPSTYGRVQGRSASQRVPGGHSNFRLNSMLYQTGGQGEIVPDWYLGGAMAYRYDSLRADNRSSSGRGDSALGAITLKHERGPWHFAGALGGSIGWYNTSRNISLPKQEATAEASQRIQSGTLALRAAYTHTGERYYVRPMVTLTGIYTHASSHHESGAGPLNLKLDSESQAALVASPGIELGRRTDLANGNVLRSYFGASLNFSTADSWDQRSSFAGVSGDFTTSLPIDQFSGRVSAGFELQTSKDTAVSLRYEGEFSDRVTTHGGAVSLKYAF